MRTRVVFGNSVRVLLILSMVVMLIPGVALARAAHEPAASPASPTGATPPPRDGDPAGRGWGDLGSGEGYVEGEVLVRFKTGAIGTAAVSTAHAAVGASVKKDLAGVDGLQLVKLKEGMSVEDAIAVYEAMPDVVAVQPNYTTRELAAIPSDPLFSSLWGMNNTGQQIWGYNGTPDADIDAPEAWEKGTGSSDIVVAVMDTGVDYAHPDLDDNMWVNEAEAAGDFGVDDDANGYVDDIYGYDFINSDGDPKDDHGHGTHVAGTVGAEGDNGMGVAGVNWDVSIMALKIFNSGGYTTTDAIVEAFAYADAMGADVINCSWGGVYEYDAAEEAAIAACSDALIVCAAGNDGADTDVYSYFPAGYNYTNIISVGASDAYDNRASFSNYGATTVDVFAPGQSIWSTYLPTMVTDITYPTTGIFEDQFADLSNWDTSDYQTTAWALDSDWVVSAPYSAAFADYGDNEASYLYTAAPLDLSAATMPMLSFRMGVHLQPGRDYVYWGVYDESDDTHYDLGSYTGMTPSQFEFFEEDLGDFIGETDVYLYFAVLTDGSANSADGYTGVAIDELVVENVEFTPTVLLDDDFDTGGDGWSVQWASYHAWYWDAASGHDGAGSWRIPPYWNSENTMLLSGTPFDVVAGATVDFWYWTETEGYFDPLRLYASLPGYGYYELWSTSGYSYGWQHAQVSLASLSGREDVQLGFYFSSDWSVTGNGCGIDDVYVATSPYGLVPDYTNAYAGPWDGTSMAAPHVAGAAALMLSRNPALTPEELKAAIMDTADVKWGLTDKCVTDGRLNLNAALDAVNLAPEAAADAYATTRNIALTVAAPGVLGNDSDAEGDPMTAVKLTGPANGTVDLAADGSFVYRPDADFLGTDTFTYAASDGVGDSPEAVVTIEVAQGATNVIEDYDGGVTFGRYIGAFSGGYSGGSYVYGYSRAPYVGTRLEAKFTGNRIRWIGPKQPNYGMAKVFIDGVYQATVNCYAPDAEKTYSTVIYESPLLADGPHVVWIEMADGKDPASSGYAVVLDKFEVDGCASGVVRSGQAAGTFLGVWMKNVASTCYTDGAYAYSHWSGARYVKNFTGRRIAWIGPKIYNYGKAAVYIDGVYKGTVSQYATGDDISFRAKIWESDLLPYGDHTFEIRVLHEKVLASSGYHIVVDSVDVTP